MVRDGHLPARVMLDLNVWCPLINKEENYFPLVCGIKEGVIEPFMSDAYFIEVIERSSKKQILSDFVNVVRRLKPGIMLLEVYPRFCEKFYSDLN